MMAGQTQPLPAGARLEALDARHGDPLLRFERENRAYFAASVPDRGDGFFSHFDAVLRARLDEQDAGACRFHVLVGPDGEIVGRVNLVDIADGSADLGYRIAERATGQGLATAAVRLLIVIAGAEYGLTSLRAATTQDNLASQTVLLRAGFVAAGDVVLSGQPGTRYVLSLGAGRADAET